MAMMVACSALLVDVGTVEPHAAAPSVTIAMPRAATRHRGPTPHVVPRRLGARRLATVAAPIAS